jgi:hypothetical protein
MPKGEKGKRLRGAGAPAEFIGSLRSQRSITEEWRLERELKLAEAQQGLWERNLTTAREGVKRQTGQASQRRGSAYVILESYVQDVTKAEKMISAFKDQVANLRKQIKALQPDPAKAAKRAGEQRILADLLEMRLEGDRAIDAALETVRHKLQDRAALCAAMRERAITLEFASNVDLDERRFDALLSVLPQEMARDSERFVQFFLGREEGRSEFRMHYCNAVLPETLASGNAFRSGDCAMVTKAEASELERIINSKMPPAPPAEILRSELPKPEPIPDENIQWTMLR